jgi:hypothetical protein
MCSLVGYISERLNPRHLGPVIQKGREVPRNLIQHNKIHNREWREYILTENIVQDEFNQIIDQYELRDWDSLEALSRAAKEINYDTTKSLWNVKDKKLDRCVSELLDDLDSGEALWYLICIAGRNDWPIIV